MLRTLRWIVVTCGIIVLTSVTIDATSFFSESQSALSFLAREATRSVCPEGQVPATHAEGRFCIDRFERSVGPGCPVTDPAHTSQSAINIDVSACRSVSTSGALPWRYVTRSQARELCAREGMRLPRQREWYAAALGTPDPAQESPCNITGSEVDEAGRHTRCISGAGAYDMIGNVWEWTLGSAKGRVYEDRQLPRSGYVTAVDAAGLARSASDTPSAIYHQDYFWSSASGTHALIRGGFYGSGADAGLYSVHADLDSAFASNAVGVPLRH